MIRRGPVRWLLEHERPEFDYLLDERHYLESERLSGQTLCEVAELDGVWDALGRFGAATPHFFGTGELPTALPLAGKIALPYSLLRLDLNCDLQ